MVQDGLSMDLTQVAAEQQHRFDITTTPAERKERGQFGTPRAIAKFMAGLFSQIPSGTIRILDPGAGVGTLSAALCERILSLRIPRHLQIELWESNAQVLPYLRETMGHCQQALARSGHRLDYSVCVDDFVLANSPKSLFEDGKTACFDFAILNPPYYKVRKESPQSRAMNHIVHGQPNVYAFFMAVAVDLLRAGGEIVAITPRSYFNGQYFNRFRQWYFERIAVRQIHVFESRSEAFRDDEVLQENVIVHGEKSGTRKQVLLTTSVGRDLTSVQGRVAQYTQIIDNSRGNHIVRFASNQLDDEIVSRLDALPNRFGSLGLEVSTGPVVTFRSTQYLRKHQSQCTAPLLWMHNVRPFQTQFPAKNGKPCHIEVSEHSMRLLVPAKRYVLLKRFTAKEEKRRLVAGIMEPTDSYSEWVGLENHLNYVYRKCGELSKTEAFGISALFNSMLVDQYFRAISGNTQVNATEIRAMPMPDEAALIRIGEQVARSKVQTPDRVERIVGKKLGLPKRLVERLCEAAK